MKPYIKLRAVCKAFPNVPPFVVWQRTKKDGIEAKRLGPLPT
jgi:hypothetical protein